MTKYVEGQLWELDNRTLVYVTYPRVEEPDGKIVTLTEPSLLIIQAKESRLMISDPDGAERDYWLNRIGVLSDEDFQASAKKLQAPEDRKVLYDLLDDEQEESAKKLKRDKAALEQENKGLLDRLKAKNG